MNRKEAREFAMKCVFQMEAQKEFTQDVADKFSKDETGSQKPYLEKLLKDICENIAHIDSLLNAHSDGWPVSRMAKTDLAILRVAVCEILYSDIPKAVSINEAVELAKTYGTEQSSKFVNAVLKNIE